MTWTNISDQSPSWSPVADASDTYIPSGWDTDSEDPDVLDHWGQVGDNTLTFVAVAAFQACAISDNPNLGDGDYIVTGEITATIGNAYIRVWLGDNYSEVISGDGNFSVTVTSDFSVRPEIRLCNEANSTGQCTIELFKLQRLYADSTDKTTSWTNTSTSSTWTPLTDKTTVWS